MSKEYDFSRFVTPSTEESPSYDFTKYADPVKPITTTDSLNELGYGMAVGTSITDSLGNIMETRVPLGRIEFERGNPLKQRQEHFEKGNIASGVLSNHPLGMLWNSVNPQYVPPSAEFMSIHNQWKAATDADIEDKLENKMFRQLRGEKVLRAMERYPDAKGDTGWSLVGEIGSMLVDPTTLTPLGATKIVNGVRVTKLGSAAAAGGALAGSEVGLAQYSQTGHVDWASVGMATALGSVLTFGIAALGNKFRQKVRFAADNQVALKTDDLLDLDDYGKSQVDDILEDPAEFIDAINTRLELPSKAPQSGTRKSVTSKLKDIPGAVMPKGAISQDDVARRVADEITPDVEMARSIATHSRPEGVATSTIHDVGTFTRAVRHPFTGQVVPVEQGTDVADTLSRLAREDEAWQGMDAVMLDNVDLVGMQGKSGHFYTISEAEALERTVRSRMSSRQAGAASTQLLTAGTGAGVGYLWDGPEGAIVGLGLGLVAPWGAQKLWQLGSTKANPFKWARDYTAAHSVASPKAVLEKMGIAGQKLSYNIGIARNNAELAIADKLADLEMAFSRFGLAQGGAAIPRDQADKVMRILQKTIDPRTVEPAVRQTAQYVRRQLNQAVKDSVDAGLISVDRGKELLSNAATKGYWPRVYNDAFLATREGEDLWVKTLTNKTFSKDEATALLKSVIGEHNARIDEMLNDILVRDAAGNPTGAYKFTIPAARMALSQRKRFVAAGRSMHMERSRKLNFVNDEILKPFLISDPHFVLSHYFQDVYKQVHFAKVFGANDEKAISMFNDIGKGTNNKNMSMAAEVYWGAVGDPRAANIKQMINMNEGLRTFFQKADAITTLNLTLAQILNMGQATINGSIALMNYSANPVRAAKLIGKAWYDVDKSSILPHFIQWKGLGTGTQTGREVGVRSAAALETTMLQFIGEMSNLTHTISGRNYAGGIWNPINIINNPTTFLRATGFIGVEELQRKLAANMGFQAAKDILERKSKALADGNQSLVNRLDKHLTELGIPTNANPQTIIDDAINGEGSSMLRAGLRFSNMINFRNNAEDLPLMWQSPYARIFRKFKTFAFHQGKFIKDKVLVPAMNGNIAPLATWAAMALGPGAEIADFRRMLRGADPEEREDILDRLSTGMASIGSMGIFWDTLSSTAYGAGKPVEAVAGPAISHATGVLHGAYKSLKNQDAYDLARSIVDTQVFPYKTRLMEQWER